MPSPYCRHARDFSHAPACGRSLGAMKNGRTQQAGQAFFGAAIIQDIPDAESSDNGTSLAERDGVGNLFDLAETKIRSGRDELFRNDDALICAYYFNNPAKVALREL